MPKITPGNRLYFYQLFQREIGFGNQVRIAVFADALAADDIAPADCGCETAEELLEGLGEFLKITTFKKGRVFATLQQTPELDEMLAKAKQPSDDKDVRAGKSWKRKRAGKIVKPAKPRHKRQKAIEKSAAPETATEAVDATEAVAEAEASAAPEVVEAIEPEAVAETEPEVAAEPEPTSPRRTSTSARTSCPPRAPSPSRPRARQMPRRKTRTSPRSSRPSGYPSRPRPRSPTRAACPRPSRRT